MVKNKTDLKEFEKYLSDIMGGGEDEEYNDSLDESLEYDVFEDVRDFNDLQSSSNSIEVEDLTFEPGTVIDFSNGKIVSVRNINEKTQEDCKPTECIATIKEKIGKLEIKKREEYTNTKQIININSKSKKTAKRCQNFD